MQVAKKADAFKRQWWCNVMESPRFSKCQTSLTLKGSSRSLARKLGSLQSDLSIAGEAFQELWRQPHMFGVE